MKVAYQVSTNADKKLLASKNIASRTFPMEILQLQRSMRYAFKADFEVTTFVCINQYGRNEINLEKTDQKPEKAQGLYG